MCELTLDTLLCHYTQYNPSTGECKFTRRFFPTVLSVRYGAVLMLRYTRGRILTKGKKRISGIMGAL